MHLVTETDRAEVPNPKRKEGEDRTKQKNNAQFGILKQHIWALTAVGKE